MSKARLEKKKTKKLIAAMERTARASRLVEIALYGLEHTLRKMGRSFIDFQPRIAR